MGLLDAVCHMIQSSQSPVFQIARARARNKFIGSLSSPVVIYKYTLSFSWNWTRKVVAVSIALFLFFFFGTRLMMDSTVQSTQPILISCDQQSVLNILCKG